MTWGIYVTVGLLGAVVGSFLNVVIYRGPAQWGLLEEEEEAADRGGLAAPRSYCPACRAPIPAWRLIPVASFFLNRGACAECGAKISWRYPVVELLGVAVAVTSFLVFGPSVAAGLACLYGWLLVALGAVDMETGYLPDALTFPLIVGGIAVNTIDLFAHWPASIIGAAAGYGAFWLVRYAYQALRGEEGLGLGDAKLLAGIGAWAGWAVLPAVVFIAAAGSLAIVFLMSRGGRKVSRVDAVAFGPGLAAAGLIIFYAAGTGVF